MESGRNSREYKNNMCRKKPLAIFKELFIDFHGERMLEIDFCGLLRRAEKESVESP